ncbi:Serine/threonine-protein kinase hal4 [Mycena indigotica]|uniref:non-specific serine/threonine protein kinase n=1 Tax=Mycena indigotica TaxID=2126181 RepID=A0A8H6VRI7_9AGAR|nr:Serine/threonine-protein kinase hal4 [Mycena indigotica]KAF7289336.1 Serine/threonine-protein kinase hal4 [Mycena indigotica]
MPTSSIPLPPPESSAYEKEPGHTRQDLAAKAVKTPPINTSSPAPLPSAPNSPIPPPSSVKRAASTSVPNTPAVPPRAPSRAASIASEASQASHKFTLKDLLASGPKLSRKGSARSASSRHSADSGSERSHKAKSAKSGGGESVGSLSQKYGVCQKVAIGKGATSVVRLAHKWDRSDGEKMYAVKEFRKRRRNETEKEYVKKLTAEFCISSTLHHVNIVETVDLVQDEQGKWCEVMEFCPGGDLYAAIKKGGMSPSEVECCFKQILQGIGYLHSQGVAHRDIKPENLFFDTVGHLKIGDYGASTVYRLPWEGTIHMSTGLCGSEPYIAPEQFLGKPYDARLVDIWACGIVYYCLHFQELPWRAAQPTDQLYAAYAAAAASTPGPPLQSAVPNGNGHTQSASESRDRNHTNSALLFPPTINNLSPRACRPLIRKMLEPDPKARVTIEDVLGSAWISGVEVCWDVETASHVHVNARAMARAVEYQ